MTVFTGSGVAIVTPFVENTHEIDYRSFQTLLDFHLDHGTDAIIVAGTTGESSTMTDEEQVDLIKFTVDHIDGRIPVIAGAGINDTRHAIRLSQQAENAGADALLILTPYYNKANHEGLLRHYRAIADSVDIPIIMYEVPGRTGMAMTVDEVVELSEHPNIVGLKDATGNMEFTRAVLERTDDDFAVYSGNDDLNHEIMTLGGKGVISVTANVLPDEVHELCQLHLDGNGQDAAVIDQQLEGINRDLFVEVNPIPVKYLVHKMGYCSLDYRLPLYEPSDEAKKVLDGYLTTLAKNNRD
ncbi:4-hydroxy-tetrahydrodipicolinate synthase [Suicoccus acidiformans]|uniref:4-hydroxy-tetrahydrodipicolinate synthase n=1 Tax=Suicoccus acidiformans TaxID=2036206 RepID=A0A347WKP9_9LACT|nr:4-hydroxy-tetrahydrodipicolinate synthase [Suicoccus acidiformans]AXY25656.1 4-hydroxy-tetrahydrodipicolinate synthase [Suicoccus acidiformans]